jgi:uncharacterized damage-inducible protein DinB
MNPVKLAKYQIWADGVIMRLLGELSPEEFDRDVLPPYGSIRNLCAHIILAMEFNLEGRAWKKKIDPDLIGEAIHTLDQEALLAKWRETDEKLLRYARTRVEEDYAFPNFLGEGEMRVSSGDFFMQYLLHTHHHRGQIMSALRAMGKEAKTTDYLFYLSYLAR